MSMVEFDRKVEKVISQLQNLAHDIAYDNNINEYFNELYETDKYTEGEDEYYRDEFDMLMDYIRDKYLEM